MISSHDLTPILISTEIIINKFPMSKLLPLWALAIFHYLFCIIRLVLCPWMHPFSLWLCTNTTVFRMNSPSYGLVMLIQRDVEPVHFVDLYNYHPHG